MPPCAPWTAWSSTKRNAAILVGSAGWTSSVRICGMHSEYWPRVLVALGLAIGLPCSMALSRLVSSRMHGLSPLHAAVYAIVAVLSFAVSLFAVALPARRASANLINALRCE
jgi:hypothetical protein